MIESDDSKKRSITLGHETGPKFMDELGKEIRDLMRKPPRADETESIMDTLEKEESDSEVSIMDREPEIYEPDEFDFEEDEIEYVNPNEFGFNDFNFQNNGKQSNIGTKVKDVVNGLVGRLTPDKVGHDYKGIESTGRPVFPKDFE